ncbi:hypothetical protein [Methylomonas rapida]|jgi:hypothetical protein|uniref:Uncharacterized protein n=1 Tax=Methylomonas rapida TaxID=2963939 RepID=A0ABY7GK01_9GAMM|nr:hypothetical protein [Methylomonas rapida]WAR43093.1 hypothetical protein NM686_011855 [Methylomonas rapida]
MTTIQIKLKDVYVDHLLAVISSHTEIPIDDITIEASTQAVDTEKSHSKAKLLRIAQECAQLPTLDQRSAEQILGYAGDELGLWGGD